MVKKTTIVDIAEAAGVSVSTVSRILNNKPDVAEETRQRVQHGSRLFRDHAGIVGPRHFLGGGHAHREIRGRTALRQGRRSFNLSRGRHPRLGHQRFEVKVGGHGGLRGKIDGRLLHRNRDRRGRARARRVGASDTADALGNLIGRPVLVRLVAPAEVLTHLGDDRIADPIAQRQLDTRLSL